MIAHFGLPPQSHDAKSVVNVIETFPRDELFQTPVAELIASVRGIVNLYERRRVRLFVRRDSFERFYSCLVYVPRDRYNTEVRERIERIVRERFGGTHVETQVQISDSMLARLHMLVRTPQGAPGVENIPAIEAEIAAAAATWEDRLQQALICARRRAQRRRARDALRDEHSRRPIAPTSSPRRRSKTLPTSKRSRPIPPYRSSTCARGPLTGRAGCRCASCRPATRSAFPTSCPCSRISGCACWPNTLPGHHPRDARCGSRTSSSKRAT